MKAPSPARKPALVASAVILVVAVGVLVFVFTSFRSTPPSSPEPSTVSSTPPPTPYDEGTARGGDAAPHQRENRGHLQPGDLTEEARQRLDAEGTRLTPTLDQVRRSGDITPDSVRSALISAGYPDQNVTTMSRTLPADGTTRYVVFGVAFEDGCLSGMVTPTEVDARAMGRIPEWGCITPDTH